MYKPRAWIINIGNELLIGRIINTNASWIARELTLRGVDVKRIVVVGDDIAEIVGVLRDAIGNADIVVTTGGLGPTDDDKTMEAVAVAVNRPLTLNPDAYRMVREFYESQGYSLTHERLKMALLPAGAKALPNPVGAAPGAYLVEKGTHIFVLPGVPREMEAMFKYVLEKLKPLLPQLCVVEKGILITGMPESSLAPLLKKASRECLDCYVKSHPKGHELEKPVVEVKVLASAEECSKAEAKAEKVLEKLRSLLEGANVKVEEIAH
ncbi:nicotinamide mononucleotide deamidase-related protein [Hyperthermus butylicus]|uniref:Conserved archaeal protein n=1 Tax=Hyperthermus butylicus (strain DSM 5456 / JCM 9403 / PLM1-5) TaxID=415426 RepID=A2BM72_HYPBU|nr:nicotinamide mononucleotide deamidase-related protein [Hyperthermus butylicus]ABM81083.1 conserved archaeal protein [Hyperthermus butylicus DSM 5456]